MSPIEGTLFFLWTIASMPFSPQSRTWHGPRCIGACRVTAPRGCQMSRATSPNTRGPSAAQSDASSASLYDEIEGEAEVQAVTLGPKEI